jgi:glycosyltransferase involved in cell wall biosynthesis
MTQSQLPNLEEIRPLVTVILSTYNWSEVLPYSIQSVLNQTYVNFELLVIGDGCTDNSAQVTQNFKDPRVRWINLAKNTGSQSGPNNEGLRQARGSLIAYLGHDDLWSKYHLENLTSFCANEKEVFATAAIIWFEESCKVRFISALNEVIPAPQNANYWHTPSGIIHSHSLIDKVGYWKEYNPTLSFYPDDEFFARLEKIRPRKMIGSVSVAKVPAAWRKNIYQTRDVTPQKLLLEQLNRRPHCLRDLAFYFYAEHFNRMEGQILHHKNYEDYRHFKGLK